MPSAVGVSTFGAESQVPFSVEVWERGSLDTLSFLELPHAPSKRHDNNMSGSAFLYSMHFIKIS